MLALAKTELILHFYILTVSFFLIGMFYSNKKRKQNLNIVAQETFSFNH